MSLQLLVLASLCSWAQGCREMSRRMGGLCTRLSHAGRALLRCKLGSAWTVLLRGDEVETVEKGPLIQRNLREDSKDFKPKPALQEKWDEAGVDSVDLVVRGISGEVLLQEESGARSRTPIKQVVQKIRALMEDVEVELVQLCMGTTVLPHSALLGDYFSPDDQSAMELTFLKLHGPAVTVESTSGREIKLLEAVPKPGERCHFDRSYRFLSLGGFEEKSSMRYLMTSNDDKATSADQVMWRLNVRMPVVVYLNFRSENHVRCARCWLKQGGWAVSSLETTVSSGIPNGPYKGPVYYKACETGVLDLYGSECGEGTYFVFVDIQPNS